MGIAVTEEHRALAESLAGALSRHAPAAAVRDVGDGHTEPGVPDLRRALAGQGVLGLHVPEEHGGSGYGLVELAVVGEQLGRALAPGVVVPTLAASAVLAAGDAPLGKELLPGLVDGSTSAAVAVGAVPAAAEPTEDGGLRLTGTVEPVVGGAGADLVLVPVTVDEEVAWVVVDTGDAEVTAVASVDPTRPAARVVLDGMVVPRGRVVDITDTDVRALARLVLLAEAAGIAGWCLDTAVEHATVREQFGRPIGQFQGVKHACAHMLVAVEQARAAVWDAARALDEHASDEAGTAVATVVATGVAVEAAHHNALECIQLLGGIGFTWEHDAHWYLRRATTTRAVLGGPEHHWRDAADLALDGARRSLELQLEGDHADRVRAEVQDVVESLEGLDDDGRRAALAESGYQVPHWPAPWGRDAGPVEQLVIAEQLAAAGVERPDLSIGGWILPTLIAHGTAEQQEQFILPTLRGDLVWCQLFSEPGAGSDLASLTTRAERVDGGWRLTGQKVWTSLAHRSDFGLLIARTDPDAPKHDGITAFVIDMQATEGLDIRPLREITGNEMFNEVYLDGVFVPDEMVVGSVGGGWRAARNTLANERVAMSTGSAMGTGVERVLDGVSHGPYADDPVIRQRLGRLVAEGQVLGLLGFRTTVAQLSGVEPGASSSVRKLVGGHHARACADLALELLGPAGALAEGPGRKASHLYLQSQCLTIAGGTTNVQLNVIAERLLGLPRDP